MALCAAYPELGVTGLKPEAVAVTAASFAPASPLGWPSWGAGDIPRHRHRLQIIALCAHGDGEDGGWRGREPEQRPHSPGKGDGGCSNYFVHQFIPLCY